MTLKKIWEYLWKALFNDDQGFSVRKAIAVMFSSFCIALEIKFTSSENYTSVLQYNFMFIGSLLGLTTLGNLVKRKTEMKETVELKKAGP